MLKLVKFVIIIAVLLFGVGFYQFKETHYPQETPITEQLEDYIEETDMKNKASNAIDKAVNFFEELFS